MKNKLFALSLLSLTTLMTVASCNGLVDKDSNSSQVEEQHNITVSGKSEVNMLGTVKILASVENMPGAEFIFTSSDETIATVDKNGVVTAKKVKQDSNVTITIKVKGHEEITTTKVITVKYLETLDDKVYITSIDENTNFMAHLTANNDLVDEKGNTIPNPDKFKVTNKTHLVGDDNAIDVKPVSIFKQYVGGKLTQVNYTGEWDYDIKIEVKGADESYSPIALPSPLIESIDTKNCLIDFSDAAINKSFKVRIEPKNLTDNQKNQEDFEDILVANYKFDVIDGYNAYTAKDLAVIENRNPNAHQMARKEDLKAADAWAKYKKANNIDPNLAPNSVILQAPIKVTKDDLPSAFFFSEDDVNIPTPQEKYLGSLKDNYMIYARYMQFEQTFNLYGNYFSIDASELPLIKADANEPTADDKIIVPESELLRFDAAVSTNIEPDKFTSISANIHDVKFFGNSSKSENLKDSGGILLTNGHHTSLTVDNVISRKWYQSYSINSSPKGSLNILNARGFDNYSSFVYTEGCKDVNVINSELKGCGGPAFVICDDTHDNASGVHEPCDVRIAKNSIVESYVNGTEGWFQGMGVSKELAKITELDLFLNAGGKSFLYTSKKDSSLKYFNFICIHMNSALDLKDVISGAIKAIQGSITFEQDNPENNIVFDMDKSKDEVFNQLYLKAQINSGAPGGAPVIRSSAASDMGTGNFAYAYTNGAKLISPLEKDIVNPNPDSPTVDTSSNVFKGEKIAVYAMGFMLTFDYHEVGALID